MADSNQPPDESTVDSVGGLIDLLCDRFEAAWKAGQSPEIEDYLSEIAPDHRQELFSELLMLDVAYREGNDESVSADDYTDRFCEHTQLITTILNRIPRPKDKGVPSENPAEFVAGAVFGDYEILEELGRGGMGVVFRARQRSADRVVALKVIRGDRLNLMSPDLREQIVGRFRNEARAAARLEHDHLVTVYDVGEVDGQHYYSMRFVEGHDLAHILHDGPLENRRAATYVESVARAIDQAHQHNILHRDLKPANILVDQHTDRAMVTDFGLARLVEGDSSATRAEDLLGSPSYMSPEQAVSAARTTEASDVYALGATLYHLLTGRPPFQAGSALETLDQVRQTEVAPPRDLNPGVDRDLETVCLKCLEKEPARRYESAFDLASDLQRYLRHEPILARPIGPAGRLDRWRRRNPAIAALTAVALLLLVAGSAISTTFAVIASRRAQETADEKLETEKALDQANQHLAEAAWLTALGARDDDKDSVKAAHYFLSAAQASHDTGNHHLADLQCLLGEQQATRVELTFPHDEWIMGAAWSPSGDRVLTWSDDGTARLWETGKQQRPRELRHPTWVKGARFRKDGQSVLTWTDAGYAGVWNVSDGQLIREFRNDDVSVLSGHITSSSARLLTTTEKDLVQIWSIEDQKPLAEFPHQLPVRGARFFERQRRITTWAESTVWVWDIDEARELDRFDSPFIRDVNLDQSDTTVLAFGQMTTVRLWKEKEQERLTSARDFHFDNWSHWPLSEFGSKLAQEFTKHLQADSTLDGSVEGAEFGPENESVAIWSDSGAVAVWELHSKELQLVARHSEPVSGAEFSPDGQRLLTWSADGTARIWKLTSGHRGMAINHMGAYRGSLSPDGKHLLTFSRARTRLWNLSDGQMVRELQAFSGGSFSPDGNQFVVSAPDENQFAVSPEEGLTLYQAPDWNPRQLEDSEGMTNPQWSGDGNLIRADAGEGALFTTVWDVRNAQGPINPVYYDLDEADNEDVLNRTVSQFSRDSEKLFSFYTIGDAVRVWDIGSTEVTHQFRHPRVVFAEFSLDSKRLLTFGIGDRSLSPEPPLEARIWEFGQAEPLAKFAIRVHLNPDRASGIRLFGNDGRSVLSWSDETVHVWRIGSEEPAATLRHQLPVESASFSRIENRVITIEFGGTMRIWDIEQKLPIRVLRPRHRHSRMVLSPEERFAIAAPPRERADDDSDRPLERRFQLWSLEFDDPVLELPPVLAFDDHHVVTMPAENSTGASDAAEGILRVRALELNDNRTIKRRIRELELRTAMTIGDDGRFQKLSFEEWADRLGQREQE